LKQIQQIYKKTLEVICVKKFILALVLVLVSSSICLAGGRYSGASIGPMSPYSISMPVFEDYSGKPDYVTRAHQNTYIRDNWNNFDDRQKITARYILNHNDEQGRVEGSLIGVVGLATASTSPEIVATATFVNVVKNAFDGINNIKDDSEERLKQIREDEIRKAKTEAEDKKKEEEEKNKVKESLEDDEEEAAFGYNGYCGTTDDPYYPKRDDIEKYLFRVNDFNQDALYSNYNNFGYYKMFDINILY
jgi:hypothetical protein